MSKSARRVHLSVSLSETVSDWRVLRRTHTRRVFVNIARQAGVSCDRERGVATYFCDGSCKRDARVARGVVPKSRPDETRKKPHRTS